MLMLHQLPGSGQVSQGTYYSTCRPNGCSSGVSVANGPRGNNPQAAEVAVFCIFPSRQPLRLLTVNGSAGPGSGARPSNSIQVRLTIWEGGSAPSQALAGPRRQVAGPPPQGPDGKGAMRFVLLPVEPGRPVFFGASIIGCPEVIVAGQGRRPEAC